MYNLGYKNENVFIEITIVKDNEELKHNYELINKNTPLPEFSFDIPCEIFNETLQLFKDKYNKYYNEIFLNNVKCRRPKISRNKFEEAMEFLVNKLNITSPKKLFTIIDNENTNISKWNSQNFPKINTLTNPDKTLNICKEYYFFLGMFLYNGEDYVFDWVKNIIYNETGENIVPKKKKKRKEIKNIYLKLLKTKYGINILENLLGKLNVTVVKIII